MVPLNSQAPFEHRFVFLLYYKKPWGLWVQAAEEGRFEDIPANVFIKYYKNIMEIHKDHVHMKK